MSTTSPSARSERIQALRGRRRKLRIRGVALALTIFQLAWGVIFYETTAEASRTASTSGRKSTASASQSPTTTTTASSASATPVTSSQS